MLITVLKSRDDVLPMTKGKTVVINCFGCRDVYFPEAEAAALIKDLGAAAVINTDYVCNPDNKQLEKHMETLRSADTILMLSCGVGVQTVAAAFADKRVFAACDTYPLPGYQGVTPLEADCAQCGECYLNSTGGICPITACTKGLVNGQCGGCKDGKCEIDKSMECGWERIYRRLEKLGLLAELSYPAKVRNFTSGTAKVSAE